MRGKIGSDNDSVKERQYLQDRTISHPHKKLITKPDLEAGTGYAIKYTNMIKGAAMAWLAENK